MRLSRFELLTRLLLQFSITGLSVVQQVLLVPIFIAAWSDELYRSWLVIFALSNLMIVADLGLHSYTYLQLQEHFAQPETRGTDYLQRAIGNSLRAYLAVVLVLAPIVVATAALLPVIDLFNLTGADAASLRAAFAFTLLGGLCVVPISACSAMIRAADALNALSALRMAMTVGVAASLIAALAAGLGIEGVSIAFLAAQLVFMGLAFAQTIRVIPAFRLSLLWNSDRTALSVLHDARRYIVPVSSELVLQNAPTIVMGAIGTAPAGVVLFTLIRVFASFVRQVATFTTYPLATEIGQLWTKGDEAGARRSVLVCLAIVGTTTGILTGYFVGMTDAVLPVWTHGEYYSNPVMLALLLGNVVLAYPSVTAFTALMYTGRPNTISLTKLLQFVVLVVLSAGLGYRFGAEGVCAAVFISEVAIVSIPLTMAMRSGFNIPAGPFLFSALVPFAVNLVVSLASAAAADWLIEPRNLAGLVEASLLWCVVPGIVGIASFMLITRQARNSPARS
jgi:hypothetical protein